jgi:hypothetical protein
MGDGARPGRAEALFERGWIRSGFELSRGYFFSSLKAQSQLFVWMAFCM